MWITSQVHSHSNSHLESCSVQAPPPLRATPIVETNPNHILTLPVAPTPLSIEKPAHGIFSSILPKYSGLHFRKEKGKIRLNKMKRETINMQQGFTTRIIKIKARMVEILSQTRGLLGSSNATIAVWPCRIASRSGVRPYPSGLLGSTSSLPSTVWKRAGTVPDTMQDLT